MDSQTFETSVRKNIQDLSNLVEIYDNEEQESEFAEFAKYDPLKNLIQGLAEKLSSEQNLDEEESLKIADEIVRKAEYEIKKTSAKTRICAALKSMSEDSVKLAPWIFVPMLTELSKTGVIAISVDPSGILLMTASCIIIARMGVALLCVD
ncbi:hypothetical protein [Spirulina sp. 06S082]|uniref:hypothetical protein n=1 Tax=Spirulina sp. 06S082 TaxID=3110248 RepID=UPI002B1FE3E8|nr:hypothetical protein [Spirulina sp. 06S082]MEA5470233.1 hypothetical protein [Spirulina sp. 06S082]